jgi:hypothetical protein
MAKRLDAFPGGPPHDWDKWLDGSPWLLRRGEDFEIGVASMRAAASRAARGRGLKIRTRLVRDDDGVEGLIIQAVRSRTS